MHQMAVAMATLTEQVKALRDEMLQLRAELKENSELHARLLVAEAHLDDMKDMRTQVKLGLGGGVAGAGAALVELFKCLF